MRGLGLLMSWDFCVKYSLCVRLHLNVELGVVRRDWERIGHF